MPLRPDMEPGEYLDILLRRKWLIVFSFLIILLLALVYCVLVPDLYRSQTKILIIPPTVAEGMVRSTVNVSTRDRLMAIQQDTFSRTRLLGVINSIGMARLGFEATTEEEMLGKMKNRIELEIEKNPERNPERNVNTFVLSFLHEDPKVAQDVTSSLGALFIGENIKLREAVTQETSMFLEAQLEETRIRLEQQEERLKNYKLRFGGELPQQEGANLSRLQRLQDQIKNNTDAIARLQDRKTFLESQLATIARGLQGSAGDGSSLDQMVPLNLLADLEARKKKLEEVSRKYTERHPAVVQARWEVEQTEAQIAEARKEAKKGGAGGGSPTTGLQRLSPEMAEVQRLRTQISQVDLEINALKRENANASRMIDQIQYRVDRLPQREQEMISLTRDYDKIKKSYDDLLDKKLKANISRNLEENQKGERFQVVEPANLPGRPSEPNRLKVILLALMGSVAVGIGGAFLLEVTDP
ncbi:MAG: chain-length determining protein, partial [Deltaproteobacteria bacterium]|nr:chain-length determining protein [Deltaproteobacteria bacterium]